MVLCCIRFVTCLFLSYFQVIFPALDIRVKNVARTYSLEHEGESVIFDQLFTLLDSDMQNEESFRRELASCTGALQTSINQHMSKEEEQVIISNKFIKDSCYFVKYINKIIVNPHFRCSPCSLRNFHLRNKLR